MIYSTKNGDEFIIDQSTLKNAKVEFTLFGGRKIKLKGHDSNHCVITKKFTPHELKKIIGNSDLKAMVDEKGYEEGGALSKENFFTQKMAEIRHKKTVPEETIPLERDKSAEIKQLLKNRPKMDPNQPHPNLNSIKIQSEFKLDPEIEKKNDKEKIDFLLNEINEDFLESNHRFAEAKTKFNRFVELVESNQEIERKDGIYFDHHIVAAPSRASKNLAAMQKIAENLPEDLYVQSKIKIAEKLEKQIHNVALTLDDAVRWATHVNSLK